MKSNFEAIFSGRVKIDNKAVKQEVNKTVKEVNESIDSIELTIDTDKLVSERKRVAALQNQAIQERIKLEAQLATNTNSANQYELRDLEFLAKRKERIIELMDIQLRKTRKITDEAKNSGSAEAMARAEEEQEKAIKKLEEYSSWLTKVEEQKKINQTQIEANNKIEAAAQKEALRLAKEKAQADKEAIKEAEKQAALNAKADTRGLAWAGRQEVSVAKELLILEGQMANSKKLANSSEAQALQQLILRKKETLALYKLEVQRNGANSERAQHLADKVKELTDNISIQKVVVKNFGNQSLTIWEQLAQKVQEYIHYVIAAVTIQQASQAIRQMVNEVMELDSALVELRKVTDLEGESLDRFVDKAYVASREVAHTGREMIEASTEFAKSGYNADISLELGKTALMYSNVADEAISAGDAASFIIAQMKAFNIEAKDSTHIIDAVNEVSNKFAVSSADIANNLGKASAVVANAGNSMEQYIGMITAIAEITRSADKAANGMKTLTLRLQGMNDEGEKDLEVQAKMEEMFNKLGISVYKANGELKSTYEIMDTLAPVYKTLTNAEKAYVTETIAGKYQAQNAAALLQNWAQAVKATETAIDSQGSTLRENAVYLDSIQGKIKAFQSAFQELSQDLVDSDLIKLVVDLGTAVLKFANSDVGQVIIKLSLLIGTFKVAQVLIPKLVAPIKKVAAAMLVEKAATEADTLALIKNKAASLTLSDVIKTLAAKKLLLANGAKSITAAEIAETASTLTLSKAFKVLTASMLKNPIFWGAAAIMGVSLLIKWLDDLSNAAQKAYEKAKEEADAALEEYDKAKSEVEKLNSELKTTKSRIEELQEKDKLSFTDEEELKRLKEQTAELEKQIAYANILEQRAQKKANKAKIKEIDADLFTNDVTRYRNNNNKVANTIADLGIPIISDVAANMTSEAYKISEMDVIEDTREKFKKYAEKVIEYQKEVNDLKQQIVEATQNGEDTTELESRLSSAEKGLNDYKGFSETKKEELTEYAKRLKEYSDAIIYVENATDEADIKSNQYKESLARHYRQIIGLIEPEKALGVELDYISTRYSEAYKNILELNNGNKLNEESLKELLKKYPELENYLNSITNDYGWSLIDIINGIKNGVESTNEVTDSSSTKLKLLIEQLDNIQEAYNTVKDALEEYNENGYFSIDTLEKLLTLGNDYMNALMDENGKIRDNTNAFKILTNAKLDDIQATEDERYYNELLKLSTLDEAGAAQLAASSINAHDNAMAGQEVNAENLRKQIQKNIEAFNEESAAALQAAYDIVEARHKQNNSAIDKTRFGLTFNLDAALGRTTKSSKSEKEWWETELQNIKDQYSYNEITIEEYIDALNKLLGKTQQGSEAWKKINEELQKQRLAKVEDDYKAGRISLDEYIASLRELAKAYKEGAKAWNDLAEKIKKGLQDLAKETKSNYDDAKSAVDNILDDEIKKLDEKIDKLKEANDETQREIELARLQEALANAQKNKTKRVWNGSSWEWVADQDAINSAQEALDDFLLNDKVDELEKEKELLQDLKNSYADITKIYDDEQKKQELINMLGADAEKKILNDRLNTLEEFKNKYLAIQKQIDDYDKATPESLVSNGMGASGTNGSSSSNGSTNTSNTLDQAEIDKLAREVIAGKYGNGATRVNALGNKYSAVQARVNELLKSRSYSSGGIVDYTGLAMLHGSPSRPEVVMNFDQMKRLMAVVSQPRVSSNNNSSAKTFIYNFSGDFNLPNVDNAQKFLRDLKAQVGITKHSI